MDPTEEVLKRLDTVGAELVNRLDAATAFAIEKGSAYIAAGGLAGLICAGVVLLAAIGLATLGTVVIRHGIQKIKTRKAEWSDDGDGSVFGGSFLCIFGLVGFVVAGSLCFQSLPKLLAPEGALILQFLSK